MQRNFQKLKINKSSTKKIKLAWDSVYRNEYDEGLKFLILGLLDKDFSLDGVIQEIKNKRPIQYIICLLYTSPSPRDVEESRMPSSA